MRVAKRRRDGRQLKLRTTSPRGAIRQAETSDSADSRRPPRTHTTDRSQTQASRMRRKREILTLANGRILPCLRAPPGCEARGSRVLHGHVITNYGHFSHKLFLVKHVTSMDTDGSALVQMSVYTVLRLFWYPLPLLRHGLSKRSPIHPAHFVPLADKEAAARVYITTLIRVQEK